MKRYIPWIFVTTVCIATVKVIFFTQDIRWIMLLYLSVLPWTPKALKEILSSRDFPIIWVVTVSAAMMIVLSIKQNILWAFLLVLIPIGFLPNAIKEYFEKNRSN